MITKKKLAILFVALMSLYLWYAFSIYEPDSKRAEQSQFEVENPAPATTPSLTPSPTALPSARPQGMTYEEADRLFREELGAGLLAEPEQADPALNYCYVEKDGSFYMSEKDCMAIQKADPNAFRRKAYENCKEGKNPQVKTAGAQRDEQCTALFGLSY